MSRSSPSLKSFKIAQRLLAYEAATFHRAEADLLPLALVADRLRRSLVVLAGVAGFRSLLGRALTLAQGREQVLRAVVIEPDGSLKGLGELDIQDQAGEAGTILIAEFLGLLDTFIGESLTLALVREAWPDLTFPDEGILETKQP